jgi:hypothetical protein
MAKMYNRVKKRKLITTEMKNEQHTKRRVKRKTNQLSLGGIKTESTFKCKALTPLEHNYFLKQRGIVPKEPNGRHNKTPANMASQKQPTLRLDSLINKSSR